jgi:ATP-dependent Lon protease
VLVEGGARATIQQLWDTGDYFAADIEKMVEHTVVSPTIAPLMATLLKQFEEFATLSKKIPAEVLSALAAIDELGRLVDTIAMHMPLEY